MVRRCREVPRSSEKFREVPRSSEKCVRIGLHHDMRGRCAPGMAANHGKIGLNRGTWVAALQVWPRNGLIYYLFCN